VKHLLSRANWEKVAEKISGAERVNLYLDYDGTLAPIRKRPHLARIPTATKRIVRGLAKNPKFRVCIISGRSLAEIQRMMGMRNLIYVGNHGMEIKINGKIDSLRQAGQTRRKIQSVCRKLKVFSRKFPGFWAENKGLTASLHYRLVSSRLTEPLAEEIKDWLNKSAAGFRVRKGKKVWEIRPRTKRNKGWAVKFMGRKLGRSLEIYVGDDLTDLDALRVVKKNRGIAVQVGILDGKDRGYYYLRTPKEVEKALRAFLRY
jgi:trehalose-phosphatase